nr:YlxM family DNA-binding protein [uncultured Acetatifactor sp.]
MDKIYEQTMLFDFYGELLTEHQRSVYEDAVYRDMSLGEIAQERGISRQGVHDLIKRCDRILQGYESKLHLVERFARAKKTVTEIEKLTLPVEAPEEPGGEPGEKPAAGELRRMRKRLQVIRKLSRELLEEL